MAVKQRLVGNTKTIPGNSIQRRALLDGSLALNGSISSTCVPSPNFVFHPAFRVFRRDLSESPHSEDISEDSHRNTNFESAVCRGMKFENVSLLIDSIGEQLDAFGETVEIGRIVHQKQSGVFRTNCMDCLEYVFPRSILPSLDQDFSPRHVLGLATS